MTMFGTLHSNGNLTNVREIKQSDIGKCPFVIFDATHYRDDGTCKCNDTVHRQRRGDKVKALASGKRLI